MHSIGINFKIKNKNICAPTKVKKAKMYGSEGEIILGDNNELCKTVSLAL